ncbi:hypothetical protein MRBLME3_000496 [Enterobacter ludwigii]|uniref:hypothetical protein n=1 Tax=Enterobacter ludwigii TaxID=299767 RepID=UPI0034843071
MSNIDKRALRKAAMHAKTTYDWGCDADNFHEKATPDSVLALLDELEAKDKLNSELMEKQRLIDICQGQGLEHRIAAEKRAEAAEKRIAELEAREVKLPAEKFCPAEYAGSQLWEETEIWNKAVQSCEDAIRTAGINLAAVGKGE